MKHRNKELSLQYKYSMAYSGGFHLKPGLWSWSQKILDDGAGA